MAATLPLMRPFFLLCLVWLPATVLADGKVFPPTAIREPVTIPDQQALIHWADGIERLVIQTTFNAAGTNFAWVVPLPAKPLIERAPSGLFPTLSYLFQPELVHNVTPWYLAVVFGLGMLGLLVEVKRGQPLTSKAGLALVTVCAAAFTANLALGIVVAPLLCLGVFMVRRGSEPVYILLVLLLTGMLLAGLLLPALSTAASRGSSASGQAPEILDRRQVGLYDTVTLSANEPADLVRWLHDNGFAISSNALPVLADYTKRQWIFVAAKLMRTNSARQTESIHPLSFTFRSAEPVYPMRLTGVDSIPLSVDLYVFGPGTASADGFVVEHSSRPEFPDPPNNWVYWKPKTLQIHSPALRKWVNGAEVATKLTGTLSTSQQSKDVIIRWGTYYHKITKEFSHAGAAVKSANTAAAGLLGGMILLGVFRLTSVRVSGAATWSLVIAVAVTGFATYVSSNKVQFGLQGRSTAGVT